MDLGVQQSPSGDPGASPGQTGPACSGGAGGRREVAGQPVAQLARTTDPACPAYSVLFCLTAYVISSLHSHGGHSDT